MRAIACLHVQIFPLRRNRGIITKSDRPKGVLRNRPKGVLRDRPSVCSSFSLEKNPRESS
ncbi:hypothetical protein, partial [Cylindrospermopsis raciborskii]|uniref:hypothetical protein n=1 Tax=Cylindrospermopsis raciborskii TaxID=77022 RepID=UPI001CA4EE65